MGKNSWGRLYCGTRHHRKIVILRRACSGYWQAFYVLLEIAFEVNDNGYIYLSPDRPYTTKELAKELGISPKKTEILLENLQNLTILSRNSENLIHLLSYNERQFISDKSTERVRKYRKLLKGETLPKRFRNKSGNVSETDQNRYRTDTEHINKPPLTPPKGGDEGFEMFWSAYPKKVGKKAALKAYKKAKGKPEVEMLTQIINRQKMSEAWQKDDGQYIPHPTTWLNEGRWDDELDGPSQGVKCPKCKVSPCICKYL